MTDHVDSDGRDSIETESRREGGATVESYDLNEGVVLYDAENPLAWMESNAAVSLREQA